MRFYKFPKWQQWFYPSAIFDFHGLKKCIDDKIIYLTFDDGPTPGVTSEILDILDQYNAKATFFCVGDNVEKHPLLFQEIRDRGHSVGNHSMTHLNGFKTSTKKYTKDVLTANELINSNLFRPPYGKCTPKQHEELSKLGFKIIFWSHLSYDFDHVLSQLERFNKIKMETKPGSVIVFHDTAYSFVKAELLTILDYYKNEGYRLQVIEN